MYCIIGIKWKFDSLCWGIKLVTSGDFFLFFDPVVPFLIRKYYVRAQVQFASKREGRVCSAGRGLGFGSLAAQVRQRGKGGGRFIVFFLVFLDLPMIALLFFKT